jgi:hypothetical protein
MKAASSCGATEWSKHTVVAVNEQVVAIRHSFSTRVERSAVVVFKKQVISFVINLRTWISGENLKVLGIMCYRASSVRRLLLHKLMCISHV